MPSAILYSSSPILGVGAILYVNKTVPYLPVGNGKYSDGVTCYTVDNTVTPFTDGYIISSEPCPSPTPTPTTTPTSTITPTQTPSQTPTQTPTNTITPTNTQTPTQTPTNTPTNTITPTNTPTNTPTRTPTNTPTNTTTPTNTPTNTITPTNTPSNTPTKTVTPTNTPSPTRPRYNFYVFAKLEATVLTDQAIIQYQINGTGGSWTNLPGTSSTTCSQKAIITSFKNDVVYLRVVRASNNNTTIQYGETPGDTCPSAGSSCGTVSYTLSTDELATAFTVRVTSGNFVNC